MPAHVSLLANRRNKSVAPLPHFRISVRCYLSSRASLKLSEFFLLTTSRLYSASNPVPFTFLHVVSISLYHWKKKNKKQNKKKNNQKKKKTLPKHKPPLESLFFFFLTEPDLRQFETRKEGKKNQQRQEEIIWSNVKIINLNVIQRHRQVF